MTLLDFCPLNVTSNINRHHMFLVVRIANFGSLSIGGDSERDLGNMFALVR